MEFQIALMLVQDGITNGAIYALLALALVLVFAVTRVIFIPQGEFVAYGALTLAMLQAGVVPTTVWLLVGLGVAVTVVDGVPALRSGRPGRLLGVAGWNLAYPLGVAALVSVLPLQSLPQLAQVALALAVVVPMGPQMYRLVYQPIASAPILILLIVSVAAHLTMVGLGLLFFGAEGFRNPSFWDIRIPLGPVTLQGQTIIIFLVSIALIVLLWLYFDKSLRGKALRATAVNRTGARLMGISSEAAGQLTFLLAALIGALSGLLIGPTTTVFYDSGFLIGLKGFVAAVVAGLSSYPGALFGALFVGIVESFGAFWASAFKEVIVFTLVLPVLLIRSLRSSHSEEEH